MKMIAVDKWLEFVRSGNASAFSEALHPDIVFESPVVRTPQRGRDIALKYLSGAVAVLGGPRFRFTEQWRNEHGAVLEFTGEIDGIAVNGVDIVTVSEDGRQITGFKVMVRPLKAVNVLHEAMGRELQSGGTPA